MMFCSAVNKKAKVNKVLQNGGKLLNRVLEKPFVRLKSENVIFVKILFKSFCSQIKSNFKDVLFMLLRRLA